ncbi:hypothetical protein ASG90_09350 [Nocardioides sp. Soil797]|nr:hypothetical protein ASG90_09350 [Nocardioides sp. Soil797]
MLVPIALQVIGGMVSGGEALSYQFSVEAGESPSFDFNALASVFNLIGSVVGMILAATMVRLALDVVDGNEVSFGGAFSRINFGQVIIAAVVLGIATTIGMLLCFLPGLVVVFLTYFTNYFIIGKGQDAFTAIKSSFTLTTSTLGPVLLLMLLSVLVVIGGVIACCVGILVAYPVVVVAAAYAFRFLHQEPIRPL